MTILSTRAALLGAGSEQLLAPFTNTIPLGQAFANSGGSLRTWLEKRKDVAEVWWLADSLEVVLPGGTEKVRFLVIAEGWADEDLDAFRTRVEELFLAPGGLLGQDFYKSNANQFAVSLLNLTSIDSGVTEQDWVLGAGSIRVKSGNPPQPTLNGTTVRSTPLNMTANGAWDMGWIKAAADTEQRLQRALAMHATDYDILAIVLNTKLFGANGGGGRTNLANVDWSVIAHELGHALGGLGDEYGAGGTGHYDGDEPLAPNQTKNTDRETLKWRAFVDAKTPIPSGGAVWNAGTKPATWDDNVSVGVFEGAAAYDKGASAEEQDGTGIYRPALSCRMNGNTPPFCPVCNATMKTRLDALVAEDAPAGSESPTGTKSGYVRVVMQRTAQGELRVVASAPVAGPLRSAVIGTAADLAAELRIGDDVVGWQPLADAGIERAVAPPGQVGHHFEVSDEFTFTVRLPAAALRPEALPDVAVRLVRIDPRDPPLRPARVARPDLPVVASLRFSDAAVPRPLIETLATHVHVSRQRRA